MEVLIYPNGVKANDNLNISVRGREIIGIIGPNGAGKTTLIRQVLGLLRPTNGEIEIFGEDISNLGLLIENVFIAQGIIPVLSWVFLIFAPVYYSTENLYPVYTSVLLVNPVTHCLSLVRFALGFPPIANMIWSFIYLTVLITVLSIYVLKTFKSIYILERFY